MSSKNFAAESEALAKHAFGVMRLYCREYKLSKEHLVDAVASLCIEIRDTYPEGSAKFDALAQAAQQRYERSKR